MDKPAEDTFRGYCGDIAMRIPKLIINSSKDLFGIVNCSLLIIAVANQKIAEFLRIHWQGISPLWAFLFVIILTVRAIMRAMYEKHQELYLAYKNVEEKAKNAEGKCQNEIDQLKKQLTDSNTYVSLQEAVEKLIDDGKQKQITKGMGYSISMHNDADGYYEPFAKLLAKHLAVYGKRSCVSLGKREIISEDWIFRGEFKNLCSELYFNNNILFNDLVIKKIGLDKAIQEIMSVYPPFDWLSYEVKD